MSEKVFTYEEVAAHCAKKDLWMIVHNKVYDITEFVDEHPGGEEVLLDEGAKDATDAFEDVGHSSDARDLLEKYLIGTIDPKSKPVKPVRSEPTVTMSAPQGSALRILVPLALIAAYVYLRFFHHA